MNSGYSCGLSFDTQRQRQIEKKSGYIMQDMLAVFESQEQFCSRVTFNIFFQKDELVLLFRCRRD